MSITHTDTAGHGIGALFTRLCALASEVFERAERSHHHRLGSAFVSPEALRDVGLAAQQACGRPCP